jgi:RHS repeat-associated protein
VKSQRSSGTVLFSVSYPIEHKIFDSLPNLDLTRTFDALDRPTAEFFDHASARRSRTYAGPGRRVLSETLLNGVETSWGYDGKRRMNELSVAKGMTTLVGRGYSFDRRDLLVAESWREQPLSGGFRGRIFGLDSSGRLRSSDTTVVDSWGNEVVNPTRTEPFRWTLDGVSNVVAEENSAGLTQSVFNALNQPVVEHKPSGQTVQFRFDTEGRMTQGDGRLYAYDAFSRLVEVRDDQGICISRFKYDVHGRRVAKIDQPDGLSPVTTRFIYDGDNEIEELVNGSLSFTNLCGEMIDDVIARKNHSTGAWHYFHKDALWNVTALTDALGAVAERYEYSPFGIAKILDANFQEIQVGGQSVKSSQLENPYLFLSRRWEEDTGLYFFRARYYDPVRGRFVQRDPENDALNHGNLYTYASHNPLVYTDPWGTEGLERYGLGRAKGHLEAEQSIGEGLVSGFASGLFGSFTGLFEWPFPSTEDLEAYGDLIAEAKKDPEKMWKALKEAVACKLRGASPGDVAEVLGGMAGESAGDWLIAAGFTALTGGTAGPAALFGVVMKFLLKAEKRFGGIAKFLRKRLKRRPHRSGGRRTSRDTQRKARKENVCKDGKCFVAGTLVAMASGDLKPIENIEVGEYVEVHESDEINSSVEPGTKEALYPEIEHVWVKIHVRHLDADNAVLELGSSTLLRPASWLVDHYDLLHHELRGSFRSGNSRVISEISKMEIVAAPSNIEGLVVATFRRRSTIRVRITLRTGSYSTTIEGTGEHPVWSLDKKSWVPLALIKRGERVKGFGDRTLVCDDISLSRSKIDVFNLTIGKHHQYYVGPLKALVHNANRDYNEDPVLGDRDRLEGDIPAKVPEHWDKEDIEDALQDAERSLDMRIAERERYLARGEDIDDGHQLRLELEDVWVKQLYEALDKR